MFEFTPPLVLHDAYNHHVQQLGECAFLFPANTQQY